MSAQFDFENNLLGGEPDAPGEPDDTPLPPPAAPAAAVVGPAAGPVTLAGAAPVLMSGAVVAPRAAAAQPATTPHYPGDFTYIEGGDAIGPAENQLRQHFGTLSPAEKQAITAIALPLNNHKPVVTQTKNGQNTCRRTEVYPKYVAAMLDVIILDPHLTNVTTVYLTNANHDSGWENPATRHRQWLQLSFTRRPGQVMFKGTPRHAWYVAAFSGTSKYDHPVDFKQYGDANGFFYH